MKKNFFTPLIAFIMCLASCSFVTKDFDTSDKDDLVIQLITYVLDQAHYLDKEINDQFSEDVFHTFLENLDPFKRYFYKSDIDEFSKYKYSIDDAFKNPDLEFFELVYNRYLKRMAESENIFNQILSKAFDFSKDEVCECDFEKLDFVKTKDELYERWRKLLKIYVIENYHNEIEDDLRKDTHLESAVLLASIVASLTIVSALFGFVGATEARRGKRYRRTQYLCGLALFSRGGIFIGPLLILVGMGMLSATKRHFEDADGNQ